MTYNLDFHPDALKEWHKLDESIRSQFKKKLKERLEQPRVPKARGKRQDSAAYKKALERDS